eukprot:gb/GECG01005411.1/.p1 GENE.gb/GECG01005411.1/~~gb/GECG01005411.1/.p1  ORF type:complete len:141 (+),score=8.10 gb/GECG01005411.1/:1-423(+)
MLCINNPVLCTSRLREAATSKRKTTAPRIPEQYSVNLRAFSKRMEVGHEKFRLKFWRKVESETLVIIQTRPSRPPGSFFFFFFSRNLLNNESTFVEKRQAGVSIKSRKFPGPKLLTFYSDPSIKACHSLSTEAIQKKARV